MDTSPNTKHTPGPWSYLIEYPYPNHPETPYATISAGLPFRSFPDDGFRISGIIAEADARLIAAAPDLLEACREMVRAWQEWESAVEKVIGRQPETGTAEQLQQSIAAIAKAEGK